jgi:hypothetical protein
MPDVPEIAMKPLPGVTPDQARDVRARCWDFVFQCWQEKQIAAEPAPEPDGYDDAKESNGCTATRSLPRGS